MFELVLLSSENLVETCCDALEALDAVGVSVEDADAGSEQERAVFGEPDMPAPAAGWNRSLVRALFAEQAQAQHAQTVLMAQPFAAELEDRGVHLVPDQDWVRLTQSQFEPIEITPSFWIVPTWHDTPSAAVDVLRLDPGLAFGTGTHPTTRMCLQWLAGPGYAAHTQSAHAAKRTLRVLDYGCGSGVLAMAAGILNERHAPRSAAPHIDAIDLDPAAVSATRDNAEANRVQLNASLPDAPLGEYDVVLANILATPLKVLAPLLCARLKPGASLVLAGILERQHAELTEAYAPWVKLDVADTQEGWVLMTATARST
jgi:ribosomal protein L11 methyltransferase